jgi:hypothetical protein
VVVRHRYDGRVKNLSGTLDASRIFPPRAI